MDKFDKYIRFDEMVAEVTKEYSRKLEEMFTNMERLLERQIEHPEYEDGEPSYINLTNEAMKEVGKFRQNGFELQPHNLKKAEAIITKIRDDAKKRRSKLDRIFP